MTDVSDERRFKDNLQGEVDGAAVYLALAEAEKDPNLAKIYRRLAAVEGAHVEFWRSRLDRASHKHTKLKPSLRARGLSWLARRFGPEFVLPTIAATEVSGSTEYDSQPDAVAKGLPTDERSHARIIQAAASTHKGLAGPALAQLEGRHRGSAGNALRAAVLGANDGLVSNLSLVMAIAGAAAAERTILLTGLAGLIAGACSMAMGEWLSVASARELYEKQIATEAMELQESPEEEKEELVLIYQAKGLSENEAKALAGRLLSQKGVALETLVREELGIDPKQLGGSAWAAAGTSFVLFATGAIFPVMPFFFVSGTAAIIASLASSGLALGAVGAGTSLFTGRDVLFSAARQIAIGYAAALVTYGIGRFAGIALGG
ncbi:MAG TPA: VIT1/CCC1 family protein [Micropepsaceae bacterium]|jgi:VIT1/CCC1 family predicted Fe2+/Mn2+ transporter|nr:VIT1/CCC1 family protein [Micropepsaceae bacterium]